MTAIPIYNRAAEEAVIGAIVGDAQFAMPEVIGLLSPEDFWLEGCAAAYHAAVDLHRRGLEIDFMTLAAAMGGNGAESELVRMSSQTPSALNVGTYAYTVHETAERRRAVALAEDIAALAHSKATASEFVERLARLRVQFSQIGGMSGRAKSFRDAVSEAVDRIIAAQAGERPKQLVTGIAELDRIMRVEPGQLMYLAGRPGMGKSSLAFQIAYNWSVRHRWPVLMVILESTMDRVVMRMISQQSGIPYGKLDTQEGLSEQDKERMWNEVHRLESSPLYFMPPGVTRCADIYREALRLRDSHGLVAVIIDTVNKLKDVREAGKLYEGMTTVSAALAGIAGELGVTVLALAQLSRGVEQRTPFIPVLADLRDSGALEQDGDVIVMLYRADYYMAKGLLKQRPAKCGEGEALAIVAKAREGAPDMAAKLFWDAERVRFSSAE
jgi:replicative DNA helicase